MWRRFTSSSVHKVDQKGRVSVPSLYRKALEALDAGGVVVLVPSLMDPGAIEGYAPSGFDAVAAKIARMHPSSPQRRVLEWRFIGEAQPSELDANGRIVLPPAFKAAAGIAGEAKFVGAGDKFQIWAPAAHEAALGALEAETPAAEAMAALPWSDAEGAP